MSEKIWMVGGTTGEYSDRMEWVVDAWRSEKEAQDRVVYLQQKMQELGIEKIPYGTKRDEAMKQMHKEDPAFYYDYTGTEYYVCELELKP